MAAAPELLELARGDGGLGAVREQLATIDPTAIAGDEPRIAFWLNAYNALVLGVFGERPLHGSPLRDRKRFAEEVARVGEHGYSLDQIEHGVLRLNARAPYRLRRLLAAGDPRLGGSPSRLEPRIHFALNCGAASCPPIRAYAPETLDAELEHATVAYIRAESDLDRARNRLELPYLLRIYRGDFGDPAAFAARRLAPDDSSWIRDHRPRVGFTSFDWTPAATLA